MLETTRNKILQVFESNNGYAFTFQLVEQGIAPQYLVKLLSEGVIEKVKHGVYKLSDTIPVIANESFINICKFFPKAVICLESALAYYDFSTLNPHQVSVAIERDSKVKLPQYPPMKLYYFSDKMLNLGIEQVNTERGAFRIYSKEKTVCDCVRFRNKLGTDIVKEVIWGYIRSKGKNLSLLMTYAKVCRVEKILKQYLEVLI